MKGEFNALHLVALAILAGIATACIEVGYYAFATGAQVSRIAAAQWDFTYQVRPAWWVLAAGLAMALARLARDVWSGRKGANGAVMPAKAGIHDRQKDQGLREAVRDN